jgi:hypothetical protein
MIDMSRNAVMSLDGLRRFLPLIKKMGYNCIMLYTEDTYEVDNEPFFGYMRGRYTKEEMKEIDAYATGLGLTVIPCMQTLAHLENFLRWGKVPVDCDNILLTDDERTYEFIDHMFATLSECFQSRLIHVGMDEAHMLGKGKHLDIHGYETVVSIMKRHLERVKEIAKKYDYELMIWSDMYFRPWNGGKYRISRQVLPAEVVESYPKDVIPVYWDYYSLNEEVYDNMFYHHRQLSDKTWFAGGAWSWSGFVPHNRFSFKTMIPAINACKKNKIRNIVFTLWGDCGAECSHFAQLPVLFYLAEYVKGNTDEALIKKKFNSFSGMEFDEFMDIEIPNNVVEYNGQPCNPCKYMLFSDYFNGYLDYTVKDGGGEIYRRFARDLRVTSKKSRRYGYLFDTAAKLCDVLEIKYELGVRTRRAYQAGDRETIRGLAEQEYTEVYRRINVFLRAFEKQWMMENKPHGFDVQDLRIGGLLRRTVACRQRILDYVNGKIERIDELEDVLLINGEVGQSISVNRINQMCSVNSLT